MQLNRISQAEIQALKVKSIELVSERLGDLKNKILKLDTFISSSCLQEAIKRSRSEREWLLTIAEINHQILNRLLGKKIEPLVLHQ